MQSPYNDKIEVNGHEYFSPPYSLLTLDPLLHDGMLAIGVLALLSVTSCVTLISFIIWRFITWSSYNKTFVGYNQYVLLVLNLLLADLQQSTGFLINLHWVFILAPSTACYTQGWLIHSGDLSSGLFVLTIALHTAYTALYGGRLATLPFFGMILSVWAFAYLLTGLGVWLHGEHYFVRAGSWCWVSPAFEEDRLALHYVWIFIIESATLLIYILTFVTLRRKTRTLLAAAGAQGSQRFTPNMRTIAAVKRITVMMVLYPCVYIVLTLPLSIGRMWSMAHDRQPMGEAFSCAAGALLTSCGWVDCLLYTITRRRLLSDTMTGGSNCHSRSASGADSLELGDGRRSQASNRSESQWSGQSKPSMEMVPLCDPRKQAVYQATNYSLSRVYRGPVIRSSSATSGIVPIVLDQCVIEEARHIVYHRPEQRLKRSAPDSGVQREDVHSRGSSRSCVTARPLGFSIDEVKTALPTLPARARQV